MAGSTFGKQFMVVLFPHLPALGKSGDPAFCLNDLYPQVIVTDVHISDFFMELLHRLDALWLQKAELCSSFLQGPDFAGAGAGSVQLLLGFP